MIGQYLLNKNENATVSKSKNFLDLKKAYAKAYAPFACLINRFLCQSIVFLSHNKSAKSTFTNFSDPRRGY
jgi:hypothetical protein